MSDCINKIRETAKELLENGQVEQVIGFARGSLPLSSPPVCITTPEDVEKLTFNSRCALNLANYIRNRKGKTAVVAKGCDSRNIVSHIVENQIKRDDIHIIGVPCTGMVDKTKILALFNDDILSIEEDKEALKIVSQSSEKSINKKEVLRDNCALCMHKNPVLYDSLVDELVEETSLDHPFEDVEKIQSLDLDGRWAHFQELTQNCIRCYACRNACPICYCPNCFVDESGPQWVGKGQDKTDVDTFHFLRAFHCAGRCTDCGACVEACPMNINVRDFTRKLNKDAFEIYEWEAGLNVEKRPPLDVFSPEDPDSFIK